MRLDMFGYNKLEEKKVIKGKRRTSLFSVYCLIFLMMTNNDWLFCKQESKILKFLGFMWNPLSWVMEAAAIMAIALAHGGVN